MRRLFGVSLCLALTLWLALLGGSLATGAGKHIHIDVIFRFLPARARRPAAIFNYLVAAAVCFALPRPHPAEAKPVPQVQTLDIRP